MDLLRFLVTNNGKQLWPTYAGKEFIERLLGARNNSSWKNLGFPRANGQKPRQAGQLEPQGQRGWDAAISTAALRSWVLASLASYVGPSSCLSTSHGSQWCQWCCVQNAFSFCINSRSLGLVSQVTHWGIPLKSVDNEILGSPPRRQLLSTGKIWDKERLVDLLEDKNEEEGDTEKCMKWDRLPDIRTHVEMPSVYRRVDVKCCMLYISWADTFNRRKGGQT